MTDSNSDVMDAAAFLASIRPKTAREFGEELQRLVGRIRDTGKPGSIQLTVKISPVDGDTAVLSVNDEIKVRAPEHTRQGSLAWPDAAGNLRRTDPNTMPLFDDDLRTPAHDPATGEIKEPPRTMSTQTEAEVVAGLARQADAAKPVQRVEGTVLVVANGPGESRIVDLEQYDARPRRARADRTVYDAESFAAYLHRHETPETEVYADVQTARIVAILDSHGAANDGIESVPGWGAHRIALQLTQSPAWVAWTGHDGEMLPQLEFAEFAELHARDVVSPTPADLLELAQHLEANRSVAFESGQRLADGQTRLQYKETIEAKAGQRGDLEIPSVIRLALKPYIGGPTYAVEAHFRYRIAGPSLKLGYVLDRPDVILESAFGDVVEALRDGQAGSDSRPEIEPIAAPIFLGRPG